MGNCRAYYPVHALEEFQNCDLQKFKKYYIWYHMGNYLEMYLRLPIIISSLVDTKYFDMQDLKLIEIYDKAAVVRVKETFQVENPLPGFHVPISENEDQWVPFLYENLPLICFHCGQLGYRFKDCKVKPEHWRRS